MSVTRDIQADLRRVEAQWAAALRTTNPLAGSMLAHLDKGAGKRLRPTLTLLAARAFGEVTPAVVSLATAIEMIHVATLIHDDIVDGADTRRKRQTLNSVWGNEGSVLMGDFLLSSAFALVSRHLPKDLLEDLAATSHAICDGEMAEVFQRHRPEGTEDEYLTVVGKKTASLFATACRAGALLSGAREDEADALGRYGTALGMSFQLVDDALDVDGDKGRMGKPQGADLLEGKMTLPVLHVLGAVTPAERVRARRVLGRPRKTEGERRWLYALMRRAGSAAYTRNRAEAFRVEAEAAIAGLGAREVRQELVRIARFVVRRDH